MPAPSRPAQERAQDVLAWLERTGTQRDLEAMTRYAIPTDTALGVPVGKLKAHAKELGRDHDLAAALWETDRYEARMLASFVDEPGLVTPSQMDRWCRDFDNWAICDTVCFHLFDRTPHAWRKVDQWSGRKAEYVKRAAFALLWGLAVHDREADDERFLHGLYLIEDAADDDRHFVKKAVDMALRSVGKRNHALNAAAIEMAERLAASPDPTPSGIGRHAVKELTTPSVQRRLKG